MAHYYHIMRFSPIMMIMLILPANMFSYDPLQVNRRNLLKTVLSVTSIGGINDININGDNDNENKQKTFEISKNNEGVLNDPFSIYFYGPVTEMSCFELTQTLKSLDKQVHHQKLIYPEVNQHISLHLQSGGGSLMPTFYVCDTILNLNTPVNTYIDGYVASAASLISVCGDKRYMTRHSSMLIHQLSGAASGKFNEMKDEMSNFNFFMDKVKNIYLENTNIDEITLEKLLSSDIWLDSNKCQDLGLVDYVV